MSNYIKYYHKKGSKSGAKEAIFTDGRWFYPRELGRSKDYYYVTFEGKDYRTEDFEKFIKKNELVESDEIYSL